MAGEGLHDGHRKRLRQRYIQNGLSAFADHEVVELLLTYCIPRRDCNVLAHRLLARFGTLSGVADATVDQLCTVDGISESTAVLLSTFGAFTTRYCADKTKDKPRLTNVGELNEYVTSLYIGEKYETFYVLCLDAHMRLIKAVPLARGTVDAVTVYPRAVVEAVINCGAQSVVLTHNHPGGNSLPSLQDNEVTEAVVAALKTVDVRVYDHVIYSVNNIYSYNHCGYIKSCVPVRELIAAETARPSVVNKRLD